MQRKPETAAAVYTMSKLLFRISSPLMSLLRPINGARIARTHLPVMHDN